MLKFDNNEKILYVLYNKYLQYKKSTHSRFIVNCFWANLVNFFWPFFINIEPSCIALGFSWCPTVKLFLSRIDCKDFLSLLTGGEKIVNQVEFHSQNCPFKAKRNFFFCVCEIFCPWKYTSSRCCKLEQNNWRELIVNSWFALEIRLANTCRKFFTEISNSFQSKSFVFETVLFKDDRTVLTNSLRSELTNYWWTWNIIELQLSGKPYLVFYWKF
jgi:hypothetical protein